jgi:hypothetical protein
MEQELTAVALSTAQCILLQDAFEKRSLTLDAHSKLTNFTQLMGIASQSSKSEMLAFRNILINSIEGKISVVFIICHTDVSARKRSC